jgi:hypothetical protein
MKRHRIIAAGCVAAAFSALSPTVAFAAPNCSVVAYTLCNNGQWQADYSSYEECYTFEKAFCEAGSTRC